MNYWERWVGDWKRKTAHLSAEQKGIYGELLDHIYATEQALPKDLDDICRIAGAITPSERNSVGRILREFFAEDRDGFMQQRAAHEIEKRRQYVAGQTARANRRWNPETKPDEPVPAKEPKKPKVNGHAFLDGFEAFWSAYPRKDAKEAARKAWSALRPDVQLREAFFGIILHQRQHGCLRSNFTTEGASTIPHAATWLNKKRWQDEGTGPREPAFTI